MVMRHKGRDFCLFCSLSCAKYLEWSLAYTRSSILISYHCFGSNVNSSEKPLWHIL